LGCEGAHLEDVRGVLDRDGLLDDARIGRSLARAELVDLGDGVAAAGFVRAGHARREGVPEVEPARAVAGLRAARRSLDLAVDEGAGVAAVRGLDADEVRLGLRAAAADLGALRRRRPVTLAVHRAVIDATRRGLDVAVVVPTRGPRCDSSSPHSRYMETAHKHSKFQCSE
jgi:hypothetical protein